jgi:FkbM family methyltransferase
MSTRIADQPKPVSVALGLAALAQKRLPRAKGAMPRVLGKLVGRKPQFLITRHGARLIMASIAWDVYATMALNGNSWDYHDFEWCLNGIPDSGVFYDIGANVGYFSIEMAARLGDAVRVIAFEPQAELAAAISKSALLNNMANVKVIQAMVGGATRQAELYLAPASIHASAVADSGRNSISIVPAQMVTIDTLVENSEIPPPDMVKMDVEGSEHLVFRGAYRTFRSHMPHIFLEYIAKFDPGRRIRQHVEELVGEGSDFELFGHAAKDKTSGRRWPWFRMRYESDWPMVDGLFLKNARRPVRNAVLFEP